MIRGESTGTEQVHDIAYKQHCTNYISAKYGRKSVFVLLADCATREIVCSEFDLYGVILVPFSTFVIVVFFFALCIFFCDPSFTDDSLLAEFVPTISTPDT
jgi:hypothetical protein